MAYTPVASDSTQPLDTVDRSTAAAEFRTLKTYLNGISTVASAASPDIFNSTNHLINYTGTAICTGFVAAPIAGADRTVVCAAAASFTAGANLIIDGITSGNTLTVAAGVIIRIYAVTTTQFHIVVDTSVAATNAPPAIAAAGAVGGATPYAREDHTHAMGNLSGALTSAGLATSLASLTAGDNSIAYGGGSAASGGGYVETVNMRILQDGTYRTVLSYSGTDSYYSRIYKNGAAFGTNHGGPNGGGSYTEDLAFAAGDTVQLFVGPYNSANTMNGALSMAINMASFADKVVLVPTVIPLGNR